MKRYEAYKNCNIPWIKHIPSHWMTKRAKFLYKKEQRPVRKEDSVVTCFRDGVVTLRKNRRTTGFTEAISEFGYQGIRKGDLVIHVMDAFAGAIGVSDSDGKGTPVYNVCTAYGDSNNYYYAYALREMARAGFIQSLYRGIRERSSDFRFDVFERQYLPVPPREEQDQIVRYLDWQVSKINRLIAAKRKQIALLHEQRKRRISEAVLHGNDDGCCQKDSGVEWIGMIPEHWSVIRCKYVFTERDERSIAGEEEHLSMSQKYGLVPDSKLDERRMLSESYVGGKVCYKNDLVLNRLKAHLGVFALSPQKGVISPDYTVLIPNAERILPTYGEAVLKNDLCRRELRIRVRGIIEGFWRLYTDDFNTIVIPLPPLKEQEQIMKHLSALNNKFTALKQRLEQEINILHELRTRLISDVVTGQIDVRGIKVPDDEYTYTETLEEETEEETEEE